MLVSGRIQQPVIPLLIVVYVCGDQSSGSWMKDLKVSEQGLEYKGLGF